MQLLKISHFVKSQAFKYYSGGVIALCGVAILIGSFVLSWIKVPEAALEHEKHFSIEAIEPRSPASRRQIRPGDVVVRMGAVALDPNEPGMVQIAYREALNLARTRGETGVAMQIDRAGEKSTVSLPMPRVADLFELRLPVDLTTEAIGLTIGVADPTPLRNPNGVSISPMEIWLGGNDDIPSLDLGNMSNNESGFGHVQKIDRLLVIIPIGAILVLMLAGMYMSGRMGAQKALVGMIVILLLLLIFPLFWQVNAFSNWRGYLQERYGGVEDATALDEDLWLRTNLSLIGIDLQVTRSQNNIDITQPTYSRLTELSDYGELRTLLLVTFGVCCATFMLIGLQESRVLEHRDRLTAVVMISPSLVLLAIFVYVFIAQTFQFSLTDWGEEAKGAPPALTENARKSYIGSEIYHDLMTNQPEFPFRDSLINTFFFTLFFLAGCLGFGFLLAFLVDQRVRGEGMFRTIFLFPMSLSFVVTGAVWRWLFQPNGGVNALPYKLTHIQIGGSYILPEFLRLDPLKNSWMSSTETRFPFGWDAVKTGAYVVIALLGMLFFNLLVRTRNRRVLYLGAVVLGFIAFYAAGGWDEIWPELDLPTLEQEKGYQSALTGIVIAAMWQMSGYVMALFLAGIRGIPDDLREAARVDGCAEWQVYLRIIIPSLRPIALSAVIVLGHISLKIFDLVFAMAGPDNNATVVPGILLYTKAFRGNAPASASAIAIVMLVLVSVVIIPYLWTSLRDQEGQR